MILFKMTCFLEPLWKVSLKMTNKFFLMMPLISQKPKPRSSMYKNSLILTKIIHQTLTSCTRYWCTTEELMVAITMHISLTDNNGFALMTQVLQKHLENRSENTGTQHRNLHMEQTPIYYFTMKLANSNKISWIATLRFQTNWLRKYRKIKSILPKKKRTLLSIEVLQSIKSLYLKFIGMEVAIKDKK